MTQTLGRRVLNAAQAAYLIVVLLLLLIPLAALVPMSFSPTSNIVALPENWSLRWYREVLISTDWRNAFYWSFLTAAFASLISTTMGYLAAAAMVRTQPGRNPFVQMLILSPLMLPQVVVALATYVLVSSLGLNGQWIAISVGQSLLGLPVAALVIAASLRGIDDTVLRAAISLGGSSRQVFWHVILPLSLHGILSAAALSFLIAFDELLIAVFLATPSLQTLPVRIYQSVHFELTPAVAVISVLLTGMLCAALIVTQLYSQMARRISLVSQRP